jgi:(1->4)-alpha-D-glucan 1-alpha-D-glucosylmutase
VAYLEKASREAKQYTSWTDPVPAYDEALAGYVRAVLADDAFRSRLEAYVSTLRDAAGVTSRAQKLIQLTMPGVPDAYQGTETESLSLVDPDNRRPVDYAALRSALPNGGDLKQHLVATVLRLRRDHPDWFRGSYSPLAGPDSAIGFVRADQLVAIAPRFALTNHFRGWGEVALRLPGGSWRDVLTGAAWSGEVRLEKLLSGPYGVTLLVRTSI